MDENLINKVQFEELVLKHWTYFIDFKKLIALVLKFVRDTKFNVVKINEINSKPTQIKLSRFALIQTGFIVWVEFSISEKDRELIVGTSEFRLSNLGTIEHVQTIGNLFYC